MIRQLRAAVLLATLAGLATFAHAGPGYPPPQGGGGGGVSNPLTEDLDADGNDLLNVATVSGESGTPMAITGPANAHLAIKPGASGSVGLQNADGATYVSPGDGGVYTYVGESLIHTTDANGLSLASGKVITASNLPNPAKITSLQAWWDAADASTITKDGSNLVSAWTDKSGNSRDLAQATGTNQPTWTASVLNGFPAIDFDGTDNYMISTTNLLTGTSGEVWMVVVSDAVSSTLTAFSASDTAGDVNKFEFQPGNATTSRVQLNTYNASTNNAVRATTTTLANGTVYLVRFASSGTAWTVQVNGTDESLTAVVGSNTGDWFGDVAAIDNFVMGCVVDNTNPSGTRFFNGRVCEMVITSAALNTHKATAMWGYLAAKWGPF